MLIAMRPPMNRVFAAVVLLLLLAPLLYATTYQDTAIVLPRGIDYFANTSYKTNATYSGVILANETPYTYFTNGTYISRSFWTSSIESTNWITPEHWDNLTYTLTNCSGEEVPLYDDNLVAFWRFNGNADDGLGNYNGTLNGDASYVTGKYGDAVALDGDGDYIDFGDIDESEGINILTVCAWAKFNTTTEASPSGEGIISKGGGSTTGSWVMWRAKSDNEVHFGFYDSSGAFYKAGSYTVPDTNWHFYCGVYDGNEVALYIDSVKDSTTASSTATIRDTTASVKLGTYQTSSDWLNGSVDYAIIYNRSLSATEIQKLYNNDTVHCNISFRYRTTNTTNHDFDTTNLSAYWKLDWDLKDNVTGNSGTAYNGASPYDHGLFGGAYFFNPGGICLDDGSDTNCQHGNSELFDSEFADRTISMWVKPTNVSGIHIIYEEGGQTNGIIFFINNGKLFFQSWLNDGSDLNISANTSIETNNWYHISAVYDNSGYILFLVNGEIINNFSYSGNFASHFGGDAIGVISEDTRINGHTWCNPHFSLSSCEYSSSTENDFYGHLDDISIYDRSIPLEEIKELYYHADFSSSTWSDWQTGDTVILNTTADYLQYEAKLETDNPLATPTLTAVTISATDEDIGCVDFTNSSTWHGRVTQDASGDWHVWANITLCPTQQFVEGHHIYIEANNIIFDYNGGELTGTDTDTYHYDGDLFLINNKYNLTFINTSVYKLAGRDIYVFHNCSNITITGNDRIYWIHQLVRAYNTTNIHVYNLRDFITDGYGTRRFDQIQYGLTFRENSSNISIHDISCYYSKGGFIGGDQFWNTNISNIHIGHGPFFVAWYTGKYYIGMANLTITNITENYGAAYFIKIYGSEKDYGKYMVQNVTIRNITLYGSGGSKSNHVIDLNWIRNLDVDDINIYAANAPNHIIQARYLDNFTLSNLYLSNSSGSALTIALERGPGTVQNVTIANSHIGLLLYGTCYYHYPVDVSNITIQNSYKAVQLGTYDYDESNCLIHDIYINNTIFGFYKFGGSENYQFNNVRMDNVRGAIVYSYNSDGLIVNGLTVNKVQEPYFILYNSTGFSLSDVTINNTQPKKYYSFSEDQLHRTAIDLVGSNSLYTPYEIYYDGLAGSAITNKYQWQDLFSMYDPFNGSSINSSLWTVTTDSGTTYSVSEGCINSQGYFKLMQKADKLFPYYRNHDTLWVWGRFNATDDNYITTSIYPIHNDDIITYYNHTIFNNYNNNTQILDYPFLQNESEDTIYQYHLSYGKSNATDGKYRAIATLWKNNTFLVEKGSSDIYFMAYNSGYTIIQLAPSGAASYTPQKLCGILYGLGPQYDDLVLGSEQLGSWTLPDGVYSKKKEISIHGYTYEDNPERGIAGPVLIDNSELGGNLYVTSKYSAYLVNSALTLNGYEDDAINGFYLNNSSLTFDDYNATKHIMADKALFTLANSSLFINHSLINITDFSGHPTNLVSTSSNDSSISINSSTISNSYMQSSQTPLNLTILNTTLNTISNYVFGIGSAFSNSTLINCNDFSIEGPINLSFISIEGGNNVLKLSSSNISNFEAENVVGYAVYAYNSSSNLFNNITINATDGIIISNLSHSKINDAILSFANLTDCYGLRINNTHIHNLTIVNSNISLSNVNISSGSSNNVSIMDSNSFLLNDISALSTNITNAASCTLSNSTFPNLNMDRVRDSTLSSNTINSLTINNSYNLTFSTFTLPTFQATNLSNSSFTSMNISQSSFSMAFNLSFNDSNLTNVCISNSSNFVLINSTISNVTAINSSNVLSLINSQFAQPLTAENIGGYLFNITNTDLSLLNLSLVNLDVFIISANTNLSISNSTIDSEILLQGVNVSATLSNTTLSNISLNSSTLNISYIYSYQQLNWKLSNSNFTLLHSTIILPNPSNLFTNSTLTTFYAEDVNLTNLSIEDVEKLSIYNSHLTSISSVHAAASNISNITITNSGHFVLGESNLTNLNISNSNNLFTTNTSLKLVNISATNIRGYLLKAINISNSTIQNSEINGNGTSGDTTALYLIDSTSLNITNNSIANFTYALYLLNVSNSALRHNTIKDNNYGIFLENSDSNNMNDNYLCVNNVAGIYLNENTTNNTLAYNTGSYEDHGANNTVSSNNLCYAVHGSSKAKKSRFTVSIDQDDRGNVLVTVEDKEGHAVKGAKVLLKEVTSSADPYLESKTSDSKGEVWFVVKRSGKYRLKIRKDDYETYEEYIYVDITHNYVLTLDWEYDADTCTLSIKSYVYEDDESTDNEPLISVNGPGVKESATTNNLKISIPSSGSYEIKAAFADLSQEKEATVSCETQEGPKSLIINAPSSIEINKPYTIRVLFDDGKVANNTKIYIERNGETWTYITDDEGKFTFTPVHEGIYTYSAEYTLKNNPETLVFSPLPKEEQPKNNTLTLNETTNISTGNETSFEPSKNETQHKPSLFVNEDFVTVRKEMAIVIKPKHNGPYKVKIYKDGSVVFESDANSTLTIDNLAPGEYKVVVLSKTDLGAVTTEAVHISDFAKYLPLAVGILVGGGAVLVIFYFFHFSSDSKPKKYNFNRKK